MSTQPSQPTSLTEIVAVKRAQVAYLLIVLGMLMLALTIFWVIRWDSGRGHVAPPPEATAEQTPGEEKPQEEPRAERSDYLPAAIWSGLLTILLLLSAGWQLTRQTVQGRLIPETRRWLMAIGGCTGLATAALGFVLAWRWQSSLLAWINEGDAAQAKWILSALAIFLAGLALAFLSLQLARVEERTSAPLRRLLYGGNAVLTGLLMLLLIAVANVIAFVKLPESTITTAAAFRGLSEGSKEYLRTVNEDVNVYLVLPENYVERISQERVYSGLYTDCRALLNAVHAQNARIKIVSLSPVNDADEVKKLMQRLKVPTVSVGGVERYRFGMIAALAQNEELNSFVAAEELLSLTPQGEPVFQGENKLLTELNFLVSSGGKKPVIYFTQSNLEPSITGPTEDNKRSCREIVQVLNSRKFEVKPLLLEPGKKVDLSDASIVVVAAPHKRFTSEQEAVLREYLTPREGKAPGKVMAFLPAFKDADGNVSPTGLEALFHEYGISIQGRRMFTMPDQQLRIPTDRVAVTFAPQLRPRGYQPHPLVRPFSPEFQFPVGNVRPISVADRRDFAGYFVQNLFSTSPVNDTYQDVKFDSSPDEIAAQIRREFAESGSTSKTAQEKMLRRRSFVPIAAFGSKLIPQEEGHTEQPRVAAIGTDWFISDENLKQPQLAPELYTELTGMLLEWMREKPQSMRIAPRALATFTLPKEPDAVNLVYLPIALVLLGITALGVGVSVARRK
jgi:hypothetical protein